MSDCFVFTTGSQSTGLVGTIFLTGYAQEDTLNFQELWQCRVNYSDNTATMQAKIKACVIAHYLTERGVVIGGSDKVLIAGIPQ